MSRSQGASVEGQVKVFRAVAMVLLPREHGAYGQMAFPLVTALLIAGISAPAVAWLVAVVTAFVAHEPTLILLGRRGGRRRRDQRRAAGIGLALTGTVTVACAVLSFLLAPPSVRWSFAAPIGLAVVVAIVIAKGVEKAWIGEIAVATTFALAAMPAAMSSGAQLSVALTVATAYVVIFVAATLAVRVLVLRVRGGGSPRAVRVTRAALFGVTAVALSGLLLTVRLELMSSAALVAVTPALLLSVAAASYPLRALRLRTMGWSLVAAMTFAAAVLVVGLGPR